jgi:hypothetical protein
MFNVWSTTAGVDSCFYAREEVLALLFVSSIHGLDSLVWSRLWWTEVHNLRAVAQGGLSQSLAVCRLVVGYHSNPGRSFKPGANKQSPFY